MLTDDDKKHVLNEYLRKIHQISNKEYQRKAWILGELPGTDFDETVCQFADFGDPILKNYHYFGISEKQYKILSNFRGKFGAFWEENGWPTRVYRHS